MNIEIYTRDGCTFCEMAKKHLQLKQLNYTEYKIGVDVTRDMVVETFPAVKTLPIITIDGKYICGHQQLVEMI